MGKGTALEDVPNYGGVYAGAGTHPTIKTAVEGADMVLWLGRYASDFNTAEFTMNIPEDKIIDLQRFFVTIKGRKVDLKMEYLLPALTESLKTTALKITKVTWDPYPLRNLPATGPLTQDFLWNALSKFFIPGDCIIGETGTSAFGLGDSYMPRGSFYFNQTVWGSIGYATGAIVGACQAVAEGAGGFKRGILVTGEGSFHLTAQAVADLLRYNLKPIM
jgi:pyruvate decarboxylase